MSTSAGRGSRFPGTLRAAVVASGLSLGRIQERLSKRGVRVSVATLSYWQSGERRPGRRSSVHAVRHLEQVLRLPTGLLLGTLSALSTVYGRVAWISIQDLIALGVPGDPTVLTSRQVLRATADGPDRLQVISDATRLRALRNCSVGRVQDGVTELLFTHTLTRGETVVLEYQSVHELGASGYFRRLSQPARELTIEVGISQSHGRPHTAHRVILDAEPGVHGLQWHEPASAGRSLMQQDREPPRSPPQPSPA